jgi:hypothetical protein
MSREGIDRSNSSNWQTFLVPKATKVLKLDAFGHGPIEIGSSNAHASRIELLHEFRWRAAEAGFQAKSVGCARPSLAPLGQFLVALIERIIEEFNRVGAGLSGVVLNRFCREIRK